MTFHPSPRARARLAGDVGTQVIGLRSRIGAELDRAEEHLRLGEVAQADEAIDAGRRDLAEFDARMRSLLANAAVEREAEAVISDAMVLHLVKARVPAPPRRRRLLERATAAVAAAAAIIAATSAAMLVGGGLRPDSLTAAATDATVVELAGDGSAITREQQAGSGAGRGASAGAPTGSSTTTSAPARSVDPYGLEIRWLFDPARGLLARLRDVGTSRSSVLREFEQFVAGLAQDASYGSFVIRDEAHAADDDDTEVASAEPTPTDERTPSDEDQLRGEGSGEATPPASGEDAEAGEADDSATASDDGHADDGPTSTEDAPEPGGHGSTVPGTTGGSAGSGTEGGHLPLGG